MGTVVLFIVIIQIIYGAFVAGLNAGFIYNTFPMMGDEWIARAVTALRPLYRNFIEGIAGVQFVHRYLAILLLVIGGVIWYRSRKSELGVSQKMAINYLMGALLLQFFLGMLTLLMAVPLLLGVLHQIGAFFLFASSVFALHRFARLRA